MHTKTHENKLDVAKQRDRQMKPVCLNYNQQITDSGAMNKW